MVPQGMFPGHLQQAITLEQGVSPQIKHFFDIIASPPGYDLVQCGVNNTCHC